MPIICACDSIGWDGVHYACPDAVHMSSPLLRNYAKNAHGLRKMLAKAQKTGKKVGGYTAAELEESVRAYERLARCESRETILADERKRKEAL